MTCWRRLRDWKNAGVWKTVHHCLLNKLRAADAIDFKRAVVDSATLRAVGGRTPTTVACGRWMRGGALRLLLRERDVFEVTPGDFRTITTFSGGISNSHGVAAFRLEFADGSSGVFTALIPEPASFALMGLSGLGLHGRSRRTR